MRRLPDFICIGAMRCGTTTLWEMLGRHPLAYLPDTKELHFFDDRDGAYAGGLDTYAHHFAAAPATSLCGESSPSYLFVEGTEERIRAAIPDVRLIAILRDPVARAWSHYWFNVWRGRERLPFEKALAAESARTTDSDPRARRWFSYVGRGRYLGQLRRYEASFPRDQLFVVLLEDLLARPAVTMRSVLEFLGFEPGGSELDLPVPTRNQARFPRSWTVHRLCSRAIDMTERGALGGSLLGAIGGAARQVNLSRSLPPMQEPTRARLIEEFATDNENLEAWLGRKLPWPSGRPFGVAA
jgi:hypothetical protein